MSLQNHLAELERRHEALKRAIEKARVQPSSDDAHMHELKRKKLLLKDEIAKLRQTSPALLH